MIKICLEVFTQVQIIILRFMVLTMIMKSRVKTVLIVLIVTTVLNAKIVEVV